MTLKELLENIDNIGACEIAKFATNGDPSNKHEFEVIELLGAYAESLARHEKPLSIEEQIKRLSFQLTPAWSEDEYILASDLWKIFKKNPGTDGKKMAIELLRKSHSTELLERLEKEIQRRMDDELWNDGYLALDGVKNYLSTIKPK